MGTGELPRLGTGRDLAQFHRSRERSYKKIVTLLEGADSKILRCALPVSEDRVRVFFTAGLKPGDCASELLALGVLAGSTATALESGNLEEAADLNDLQRRFLESHAVCLTALTARLDTASGFQSVAQKLRKLIEEEARLLGFAT